MRTYRGTFVKPFENFFVFICGVSVYADIQEFYEVTLLDDDKTLQQKTAETLQVASRWEEHPPITSAKPLSEVTAPLC